MTNPAATPAEVLAFWRQAGPERWFRKTDLFDQQCRAVLQPAHEAAARGELDTWRHSADGALALLLLLDQFPRNAFRGMARMYATDAQAREIAHLSVAQRLDEQADPELRRFFYLPFMHSEDPGDHEQSVALNGRLGGEALRYALHHQEIIRRFGRFPHRNALLGRATTPEEQAFLEEGGFGG